MTNLAYTIYRLQLSIRHISKNYKRTESNYNKLIKQEVKLNHALHLRENENNRKAIKGVYEN